MMIWCVEDDKSIRDIEIYTLKSTGFEAKGFCDGKTFFEELAITAPDLIILDIMLPDMDGVEILTKLRNSTSTNGIPVIMATAKSTEFDKIQSLDIGADDYLVKPFGMMEMVSRIRAVLRRSTPTENRSTISFEGLSINPNEHTVTVDGKRVALTYKEYELLKLFMTNPRMVFTREKLFDKIWEMDYCGETRTVDAHIRTLRQKIEPYSSFIETVRNVGYRMEVNL